jgi:hypothetical protein
VGWFRRGVSQQVDLKSMQTQTGEQVSSWTAFWGKCGGILVLLVGLVIGGVGAVAAMSETTTASPAKTPAAAAPAVTAQATPRPTVAPAAAPVPTVTTAPKAPAPAARPKAPAAPALKKP